MSKYYNVETTSTYFKLGVKQPVDEKLSVIAHVGYNTWGDYEKMRASLLPTGKAFIDYKLGLAYTADKWTTELAWTDTDRKDSSQNDVDPHDERFTVALSRTF